MWRIYGNENIHFGRWLSEQRGFNFSSAIIILPQCWRSCEKTNSEPRGRNAKPRVLQAKIPKGLVLCLKYKPQFFCSFLALDLLFLYVFFIILLFFFRKVKQPRQHFFYLATIYLPSCFCIHLSENTVEGRKHSGFPRLSSDILMRTFLWSKYQASRVPTITIAMITEASARCLTRFPPTGQWLSLELLVICHVEGSGIVPGPFQIVAMKLQWHDKTTAGEPLVYPWGSVSVFVFFFFLIGPLCTAFFFLLSLLQAHVGFPSSAANLLSSCASLILSSIISRHWQNCSVLPGVASLT